jgi:hypothetical protein
VPLAGEVDLLAADVSSRRIYVVEAKHLEQPFSPPEVAFNAVDLHGHTALDCRWTDFRPQQASSTRSPPVEKLLLSSAAVAEHVPATLDLLGVPESVVSLEYGATWSVMPLVVTAGVEVAAFVREPRVPFMTVEAFERLVKTCEEPSPGWWDNGGRHVGRTLQRARLTKAPSEFRAANWLGGSPPAVLQTLLAN